MQNQLPSVRTDKAAVNTLKRLSGYIGKHSVITSPKKKKKKAP